ncbi:MAG: NADH-quinone oxidoreductase subunit C, partial [Burkholderiales bacterium]
MNTKLAVLAENLKSLLGDRIAGLDESHGELTLVAKATDLPWAAAQLHDHPQLRFEQLVDLCGVDYLGYGTRPR